MNTIRKHALKLVQLSEDMVSWATSPYHEILKIVNSETLSLLHEYWFKYATYTDPDGSKFFRFRKQCQHVYEHTPPGVTKQGLQMLSRSFGPRITDSVSLTEYFTNQFWKTGIIRASNDPVSIPDPKCNPLAVYSSTADDRFSLHYRSTPLCGFHLATPLTLINPGNTHFFIPQDTLNDNIPLVAKMQFRGWCRAFQEIAQNDKAKSGRLKIRFFIGDALQFCTALNHLRLGKEIAGLSIYSRPWSTQALRLDGPGYEPNSKDKAPLSFNVIDTSSLADDVGFINLLVAAVPLLEDSASSTFYIESMKSAPPKKEQPNLVTELFNADIGSMCTLFGLVPAAYITGITSRAKDPTYLDDYTPIFNRMNWKMATSIDSNVNSIVSGLLCRPSPENLAKLSMDVYVGMFSNETEAYFAKITGKSSTHSGRTRFPQPHYTRKSFAVFLDFLRSRITVNWNEFWAHFLALVEKDKELAVGAQSIIDLKMQCNLYGFNTLEELDLSGNIYHWSRGIVALKNPLKITTLVISIPRRKLKTIYNGCVETGHRINIIFQIHLVHKCSGPTVKTFKPFQPTNGQEINTFSALQPIFGKYSSSDNTINGDPSGWFGQSDLHLCAYVPTALLIQKDPNQCEVAIRLQPEMSCMVLLKEHLGHNLEIFKTRLLSGEYIYVANNLPGLQQPDMTIRPVDEVKQFVVSNNKVNVTYPDLDPGKGTFVTEITLKREQEKEVLKRKQAVSNRQISPCRIAIECGDYKYTCSFPFPVSTPVLKIDKEAAIIQVIAPLLTPQKNRTSLQHFYPLLRDKRYGLCTWDLPYINFSKLPKMDRVEYPNAKDSWLPPHLAGIYSDQELRTPESDYLDHVLGFKESLHTVMEIIAASDIYNPGIFVIQPRGDGINVNNNLLFIITGLYFDSSSGSIIAEANVLQALSRVFDDPRFLPFLHHLPSGKVTVIKVQDEVYRLWRRALPAMAEICRDYPHLSTCEYKSSSDLGDLDPPLCECGVGKVGEDIATTWEHAKELVTRVAISPMFAVPYLESAKGGAFAKRLRKGSQQKARKQAGQAGTTETPETRETTAVLPNVKCQECGKDGQKKCGSCGNVYYCSRDCQRRDWKAHKANCTFALTQ